MIVKQLEFHDLDDAYIIEASSFTDPWSESLWVGFLPLSYGVFEAGQLLGYAQCSRVLDEAELLRMAVLPSHRAQGVGVQLLQAVCAKLATCGVAKLMLEVRQSNLAAIALYRSCGFVIEGQRQNYYEVEGSAQGESALLMSKSLTRDLESVQ